MRREELYLADIVEATHAIGDFLLDVQEQDFAENDMLRSAVLLKLIVIGEAAAHLPEEFKNRHPEIEWGDIAAFRNIAVHEYFGIEWRIVWVTATRDVPKLKHEVEEILASEYPDTHPS